MRQETKLTVVGMVLEDPLAVLLSHIGRPENVKVLTALLCPFSIALAVRGERFGSANEGRLTVIRQF